ncbi:Myb-binding protein 1A [Holothuria leucospilota]|uniref:Myb-binding protein 1A n=1 Tax=Holothuria leucospilota TaxID=206669 RepID=A0A9Q1CGH1_HOLLE|nr:Myb-binding protein 1A [Holothuria leucospilota]
MFCLSREGRRLLYSVYYIYVQIMLGTPWTTLFSNDKRQKANLQCAAMASHVPKKGGQESFKTIKDSEFLNAFWSLAENFIEVRLKGGSTLVNILITKQKIHEQSEPSERLSPEVKYALKRLVRGLASQRKSARIGFSSTLTEVLDVIEATKFEDVFDHMQVELEIHGSASEERGLIFGNIFACHAMIQTQRVAKVGLLRVCLLESGDVISNLVKLVHKFEGLKSFLHDICYEAIVDLVKKVPEDIFANHIWQEIKPYFKHWNDSKPNVVALMAVCYQRFPEVVTDKFVKQCYGSEDVFAEKNFPHLVKLFVRASTVYCTGCRVLEDTLVAHISKESKPLRKFWKKVVLEGLCEEHADACVHIFYLLERVLPHCSDQTIPVIFSSKVSQTLLSRLAKVENKGTVRDEVMQFAKRLPGVVSALESPERQFAVLQCLFSSSGYIHFDDITKTKTVANVIRALNVDAVKMYLEWLKELFYVETEKTDIERDRRWVCLQVLSLMKNTCIEREEGWMMDAGKFLFLHGFFDATNSAKRNSTPVDQELREEIVQRFSTALDILSDSPPFQGSSAPENTTRSSKLGIAADGSLRLLTLVEYAQVLLSDESISCVKSFTEEVRHSWDDMMSTVKKIKKNFSEGASSMAGMGFQLLFLHIGLHTFNEPEQCAEILQDLQTCFQRAMNKEVSAEGSDEPQWMDVITEILLNLLSKSSHPLRTAVERTFKIICYEMTESSLQLLLDIFDPSKNILKAMSSQDGDSDEDDEEGDEEEMETSKSEKDLKEGGDDSSSSDDDDDDEEEENAPVDPAFRMKLMEALGDAKLSVGEGEESESDMSDEAMLKLDSAISSLFKTKNKSQRQDKENAEALIHFKLRVLQLLEIFIKKYPDNPLVIKIVYPILEVATARTGKKDGGTLADKTANLLEIRICKSRKKVVYPILEVATARTGKKDGGTLADKTANLLEIRICKSRKIPHSISEEYAEYIYEIIGKMLKLAGKGQSVKSLTLVSHCCFYMIRVLRGAQEDFSSDRRTVAFDAKRIRDLYSAALKDFMTKRATNLQPDLFLDLIRRLPSVAWLLAPEFADYINKGTLLFRQGSPEERHEIINSVIGSLNQAMAGVIRDGEGSKPKLVREILQATKEFSVFVHASEQPSDLSELVSNIKKMKDTFKSANVESHIQGALNAVLNRNTRSKRKRKRQRKEKQAKKIVTDTT